MEKEEEERRSGGLEGNSNASGSRTFAREPEQRTCSSRLKG